MERVCDFVQRIVRSIAGLKFHGQTYESTLEALRPQGIHGTVIGGGRIEYDPEKKTISIYGCAAE